ncbi:MAG: hypothetical protein ACP5D7_25730 [Limnospira sp.]
MSVWNWIPANFPPESRTASRDRQFDDEGENYESATQTQGPPWGLAVRSLKICLSYLNVTARGSVRGAEEKFCDRPRSPSDTCPPEPDKP